MHIWKSKIRRYLLFLPWACSCIINRRVTDDIVPDIGKDDKIVGIEILDASHKVSLNDLLPLEYQIKKAS
jgi:uncharacterized protein YuzE